MWASLKKVVDVVGTQLGTFPYVIGDAVPDGAGAVWTLHKGTRKEDSKAVSIFSCAIKDTSEEVLAAARNGAKRLRTMRHPNVLAFVDTVETSECVYLVTEEVSPLRTFLPSTKGFPEYASWGLLQITSAVSFLNNDCKLMHCNVTPRAVFVTPGGDWRLGGFELMRDHSDTSLADLDAHVHLIESVYRSPELFSRNVSALKSAPIWAQDAFGLACTIGYVLHGAFEKSDELLRSTRLPPGIGDAVRGMLAETPASRANPKFVTNNAYFVNPTVNVLRFLEELSLKTQKEKDAFFSTLGDFIEKLPPATCRAKILPMLVTAMEYQGGNAKVLPPLLQIGTMLGEAEFQATIVPEVIKLFQSTNRAMRLNLLSNMHTYIGHLSQKTATKEIFPYVAQGFKDSAPVLRELTVKSMLHLVPKLAPKVVNTEVMRHLAAMQTDDEPAIRTNTTICLGKLAEYIDKGSVHKVLLAAFTRALKDSFPPARMAAMMAFSATAAYFPPEDIAQKVLPALCIMTIDPSKEARTQAFSCVERFVKLMRENSDAMEERANAEHSAATAAGAAAAPATGAAATGAAASGAASSVAAVGASAAKHGVHAASAVGGWMSSVIKTKVFGDEDKAAAKPAAQPKPQPARTQLPPQRQQPVAQPTPAHQPIAFTSAPLQPQPTQPAQSSSSGGGGGAAFGADAWGDDDGWDDMGDFGAPKVLEEPKPKTRQQHASSSASNASGGVPANLWDSPAPAANAAASVFSPAKPASIPAPLVPAPAPVGASLSPPLIPAAAPAAATDMSAGWGDDDAWGSLGGTATTTTATTHTATASNAMDDWGFGGGGGGGGGGGWGAAPAASAPVPSFGGTSGPTSTSAAARAFTTSPPLIPPPSKGKKAD